jgi:hypothetical protein
MGRRPGGCWLPAPGGLSSNRRARSLPQVDESLRISNLGLCAETVGALEGRGITALFPIQAQVRPCPASHALRCCRSLLLGLPGLRLLLHRPFSSTALPAACITSLRHAHRAMHASPHPPTPPHLNPPTAPAPSRSSSPSRRAAT